jgi:hypothetical protein
MFQLEIYAIYICIKHFQFTPALIQACKNAPYRDPIKIILKNSSIDRNIDNDRAAVLNSILLSQGQSIYHDNAIYTSNY